MTSISIKDSFNSAADTYEHAAQLQGRVAEYLDKYLDELHPNLNPILELGAGTGFLTSPLLTRYRTSNLMITDCATGMLHLNKNKHYGRHIACFAEQLPFPDHSIELVVSNLMLQWCDIKKVFAEARRVMQKNGHFIVTTLGVRTLEELKLCYQKIGIASTVNSFLSATQLGEIAIQQRLEIRLIQSKLFVDYHPSCLALLKNLKQIGSSPMAPSHKGLLTMRQLKMLDNHYTTPRQANTIGAVYDVILLHLTAT